ncbi:MAG: hypothetical protein J0H34_20250 [Rhizobiales bacterium]|nr:hypothetical protein [Hyphomicrobiales bacterium]
MRRLALTFLLLAVSGAAEAKPFTYVNARFGTVCTFPDDVFTEKQPEPDNGDGQQWLASDGASLICSGIANIDDETPAGYVADQLGGDGTRREITYHKIGANWSVLSGYQGDRIFYERRLFGRDGVIRTVSIDYPKAAKARYDKLVGKIAASLKAAD